MGFADYHLHLTYHQNHKPALTKEKSKQVNKFKGSGVRGKEEYENLHLYLPAVTVMPSLADKSIIILDSLFKNKYIATLIQIVILFLYNAFSSKSCFISNLFLIYS